MTDNREHLERLMTEAADLPMSDADIRRGVRLARLLSGWRVVDANVDWAGQVGLVSARIREEIELQASAGVDSLIDPSLAGESANPLVVSAAKDYRALDDLLQTTAPPLPPVNWKALSARISAAVRREAQVARPVTDSSTNAQRTFKWIVRIAGPLAAAAVIVLAIWGSRSATKIVTGPEKRGRPPNIKFVEVPEESGKVNITFDEARPNGPVGEDVAPAGSGIAHGPPLSETTEPPIDPAMLP